MKRFFRNVTIENVLGIIIGSCLAIVVICGAIFVVTETILFLMETLA